MAAPSPVNAFYIKMTRLPLFSARRCF